MYRTEDLLNGLKDFEKNGENTLLGGLVHNIWAGLGLGWTRV